MVKGNQDHGREKDRSNDSTKGHSISKYKSKIEKRYKSQKKEQYIKIVQSGKETRIKTRKGPQDLLM